MFVLALFVGAGLCWAEWEDIDSGVTESLRAVYFVDNQHGWAVGDNTTIIHTDDGGYSWESQQCPVQSLQLHRVCFANRNVGICTESELDSTVLITRDGGLNWVEADALYELLEEKAVVVDISMPEDDVWFVASRKKIVKTQNAGETWEVSSEVVQNVPFRAVEAVDQNTAWFLAVAEGDNHDPAYLYKTDDGGNIWESLGEVRRNTELAATSRDVIWMYYYAGSVSRDGGASWYSFGNTLNVCPVSDNKAYTVLWDSLQYLYTIMLTNDSGLSYQNLLEVDYLTFQICDVSALDDNTLILVATHGKIARYTLDSSDVNEAVPAKAIQILNFPNPFNPATTISFTLPTDSHITLTVHDITGRKVATLADNFMGAGKHSAVFNGSDLASGVYFYRLESKDFAKSGKMLLIK